MEQAVTVERREKHSDLTRDTGVIDSWAQLAIGQVESTATQALGILQDLRAETKHRIDATLNWGDELSQGTFRFARKITDRVDHVTHDAMSRSEHAVLVLCRALRKTSSGIAGLTSSTLAEAVGDGQSAPRGSVRGVA